MPTISQQTKETAEEFVKLIGALMNVIDDLTENIPEGKYLQICEHIKDLHGFKQDFGTNRTIVQVVQHVVEQNSVVATQQRQARMRVRSAPRALTDGEKLASGRYKPCEYCDKIISKSWYNNHIEGTEYCKIARDAKKLAISTRQQDNSDRVEAIAKIKHVLFKRRYGHLIRN